MSADCIELTGIEVFGYHGCLTKEREEGQFFYVDVNLEVDLLPAGQKDDLNLTINYADVIDKIKEIVAGEPVNLIETLAERIAAMLLNKYSKLQKVMVCVHKPQAPVKGPLKDLAVRIVRQRKC